MAVQTHESARERELAEARKSLEDLQARRKTLDDEIEAKELLIQAWTNFQLTLEGKFNPSKVALAATKARSESKGIRKSGRRREILDFIRDKLGGSTTRSELLAEMNITGDKKEEGNASNALSALTKQGHLIKEGRRYTVVEQVAQQPPPIPAEEPAEEEATA
jgi:hypothetical protein